MNPLLALCQCDGTEQGSIDSWQKNLDPSVFPLPGTPGFSPYQTSESFLCGSYFLIFTWKNLHAGMYAGTPVQCWLNLWRNYCNVHLRLSTDNTTPWCNTGSKLDPSEGAKLKLTVYLLVCVRACVYMCVHTSIMKRERDTVRLSSYLNYTFGKLLFYTN